MNYSLGVFAVRRARITKAYVPFVPENCFSQLDKVKFFVQAPPNLASAL
jgi:hypothetical protein